VKRILSHREVIPLTNARIRMFAVASTLAAFLLTAGAGLSIR
jgi:hypothetical protein